MLVAITILLGIGPLAHGQPMYQEFGPYFITELWSRNSDVYGPSAQGHGFLFKMDGTVPGGLAAGCTGGNVNWVTIPKEDPVGPGWTGTNPVYRDLVNTAILAYALRQKIVVAVGTGSTVKCTNGQPSVFGIHIVP